MLAKKIPVRDDESEIGGWDQKGTEGKEFPRQEYTKRKGKGQQ
jgi:hypothetical protein